MKLGSSLRRRRRSGGSSFSWRGLVPRGLREGWWSEGRFSFLTDPKTLGVLALLCLGGFTGGYLLSTRVVYPLPPPPEDLRAVPLLAGASTEAARDTLGAVGLSLGTVDSLNHPTIPLGRIVGQSPLPGQLSFPGDSVRIVVSSGPERKPVPDVRQLAGHRARTILETAGFIVLEDSVSSEAPRGEVVSTDPEAGTEATIPQEVEIRLSLGPPEFEMPLLLGLTEEEARSVVDSLGLELREVATRFRFGRDQGIVVEQEPPAGTNVREGGVVRLVVGRRGS